MIVEFVGLMGAGKTTLHRHAAEKLELLGQSYWTSGMIGQPCLPHGRTFATGKRAPVARPLRFLFRAWASWRSRYLVSIAARQLGTSGRPHEDKLRRFRWFLTDLGNHWTARSRIPRDHVVLFDEGLVQRAITLFIHGYGTLDLSAIRRYAKATPLPDVLVYVRVDPDIARLRAGRRSPNLSKRFRGLSQDQLRRVFANAAQALDIMVTEIGKAGKRPVKVMAVDANDLTTAKAEFDAQVVPFLISSDARASDSRKTIDGERRDKVGSVSRNPQISVIVPTRDRPQFLRQALKSVQAQDCEAFECIVVDDGSKDFSETARIVRDLHDDRFRLVQSRAASPLAAEPLLRFAKGRAVNAGIEEATTDWLTFLDDDDLFAPYRLSRGLASVQMRAGVQVTVAKSNHFTVAPLPWRPAPRLRIRKVRNPLAHMMPPSSTWTLSRELAYNVGLFRPYGVLEDWEFYSRLWSTAEIWRDEAVTVTVRRHDAVRDNYGLQARITMRRDLLRSGVLRPNWASRAFQLYRLSQAESLAGNHLGAVMDALMSLIPIPYPRYVVQAFRAMTRGLRLES